MTLIDTCVLLDVLMEDPTWADWSDDAIAQAKTEGSVIINPIIYAEVSVGFDRVENLDDALPHTEIERVDLPYEAAFLAGKAYLTYKERGGIKSSPLPDFYIGAHAAVESYRLLTRDVQRFRTYFPTIELVCPN
ncbi:type II toxin-antitoxin system VapC family toxin [Nonomuraea africana]|uniref:Nucleic acid-binding protein n=1 Tax=Nonomuraea africana TaxID=46171 RepID=A0ABR9KRA0_9ACTN|nr:type II toxin-antitoxin system VapC family toxin [Nonomuraea africana]MBE1564281.1 putative nucleic acid-binding protein [Nonomuraea africana]